MAHLHDLLKTFLTLGCDDEAVCYGACRVYVHLLEEKRMHAVQYHYDEQLRLIYLTAKREPEAPVELIVPILATEELNLAQLKRYRDVIKLPSGEKPVDIVLAICDSSSTVLLYRASPGLKDIAKKLPSKGKLLRMRANVDCQNNDQ
ncbi:uncharacterized protein LOC128724525 [Anopheles nili]|uniref:uncharacterized protein LOC128724525 n=1 Tax=Anopheles nili TaxID=185578 RepID=UPI00237C0747|nr:uncharacterized protein LOC128724525 [Anopheles nili]